MALCQRGNDLPGAVLGPIVDGDDMQALRRIVLTRQTAKARGNVHCLVAGRNDDDDRRSAGLGGRCLRPQAEERATLAQRPLEKEENQKQKQRRGKELHV